MSLGNDGGIPAVMNVTPTGSGSYGNNGGWGGDWGAWIILFLIFGMFGWGGFGGFGGGWGGGNGALTRGELCQDMNFQSLENATRGIQQGLCDGFYAMQGAINGVGTTVMQGFSQAELSRCNQQAALMQQLYQMGYNQQDCCCQTQRAIEGVNYNLATQGCDTRNTIQNATRDIIDSQNNGFRAILDKMCQQELAAKDAKITEQNQRIFGLELTASQANQNNVIGARIDAATAEILRKTGAECPLPAYIVQPPQPVSFATNCSGQAVFNNGYGYSNGYGCNSGCCGCNG